MANRLQYARNFDPYTKGVSLQELQQIRRQLAKVMNQRMVRLEQAKSSVTGEAYTFGSYDKMQDYLAKSGRAPMKGTDTRRFAETLDPKMSRRQLKKEIRALQNFEQMVSSRVAGMKAIEKKRQETMKAAGLTDKTVRSKDFYDFLNSETYKRLLNSFTSEDIIEEYDKKVKLEKKTGEEIAQAFADYVEKADRISLKGLRASLGTTNVRKKGGRFYSKNSKRKRARKK